MKIEVTKKLEIKDGLHEGMIIDVQYRDKPYEYTDVVIETIVEGKAVKLKAGYPTQVSDSSKLGKLLQRFGAQLTIGQEVDPNVILVEKKCQFMTMTQSTKRGEFANVVPESVKPR